MIKHIWSVLCRRSIIDRENNNVSLFEVLEEIHLKLQAEKNVETPSQIPHLFTIEWVSLWARANGEKPCRGLAKDIVLNPSGKIIIEKEYELDLSKHKRTRIRRVFALPPLAMAGQYRFRTQIKNEKRNIWRKVSEVPLELFVERIETGKI